MVTVGLYVRLEAKPGEEADVECLIKGSHPLAVGEPATTAWFGIRLGPSTFGIFDVFPDEKGREAHLAGRIAAALMAKAPDLLAKPPVIEKVDVLAAKLPEVKGAVENKPHEICVRAVTKQAGCSHPDTGRMAPPCRAGRGRCMGTRGREEMREMCVNNRSKY